MKNLILTVLLTLTVVLTHAQHSMIYNFTGDHLYSGLRPSLGQNLISDGTYLYGTTYGGENGYGNIFKMLPDGSNFTKLHDFANLNKPNNSLLLIGTTLYGTTIYGGTNDNGGVFKINTDGTGFAIIKQFNVGESHEPASGLVYDGVYLYGTLRESITGNDDIFRIMPDGTNFNIIYTLASLEGNNIWATPILIADYLYGTATNEGPTGTEGVVYKVKTDGTDFQVLHDFSGTDGRDSYSSLYDNGSALFGMTTYGGTNDVGVIFKINYDGSGFQVLHEFGVDNGRPYGELTGDGTFLYGLTGGSGSGVGIAFKIKPDGTGFTIIHSFGSDELNERVCAGGFYIAGDDMFAMSHYGGLYNDGAVFTIKKDGTNFTNLFSFGREIYGEAPSAVVTDGTYLYGTTADGGKGDGVLFKMLPDGTDYTVLKVFDRVNGREPFSKCLVIGNTIYGTLTRGESSSGSLYKIDKDGTNFQILVAFTGLNGATPYGIYYDGTYIYGVTLEGGANDDGTIYRVKTDGSDFSLLHEFDGSIPNNLDPVAAPVSDGTYLYGVTLGNFSDEFGAVYKIKKDGTDFQLLHEFSIADGFAPYLDIQLIGSTLYGTTYAGGSSNVGVIYKIDTDGTGFSVIHNFAGGDDGVYGVGQLEYFDNYFYATTHEGGINDKGIFYRIKIDGTGFEKLHDFADVSGVIPFFSPVLLNNNFYGAAMEGGSGYNLGAIYKYSIPVVTTWEAPGVWSDGAPDATVSAIIDFLYDEDIDIVCNNLTVNSGKSLEIQPGHSVTVNGDLTNNGTVELASPADMGVSGSLITLGSIGGTGTMRANRYLHPDSWHFVSSPLNANVNAEDPFYLEYVYTYDEAYAGTENDDAWTALEAGDQIQPGVGYLVQSPSSWNSNSYVDFEGTFQTGDFSVNNLPFTNLGFNLVANPYPSAIDINTVGKTAIDGTSYVWNSGGNAWDSNNLGYATWDGSVGTYGRTKDIPPMQAFIVQVTNATNALNFDNADRLHTSASYRSEEVENLIRFVTLGNGYSDEMVVYFADDNEDSRKMFGPSNVPSIYTLENDEKMVINKLQDLRSEYSVPVGFVCDESGEYTIKTTEYTFDENSTVILEDTHTGTFTTLVADSEYTFAYDINDNELRFVLHFNKSATSISEIASNLNIYAYGKSIFVQNIENQNGTVQIFNALGQQVLATDLQTEIPTNLESGLYIVKIVNNGVETKQKVIIKFKPDRF